MKILGIDYGKNKIGLATSEGKLASPWKVVKPNKIKKIVGEGNFDKIVVGISEGKMAQDSIKFASALKSIISHKRSIELFDETLSTHDAQKLSIQARVPLKKRRSMEDAYAAAVMLQNYLDSNL